MRRGRWVGPKRQPNRIRNGRQRIGDEALQQWLTMRGPVAAMRIAMRVFADRDQTAIGSHDHFDRSLARTQHDGHAALRVAADHGARLDQRKQQERQHCQPAAQAPQRRAASLPCCPISASNLHKRSRVRNPRRRKGAICRNHRRIVRAGQSPADTDCDHDQRRWGFVTDFARGRTGRPQKRP